MKGERRRKEEEEGEKKRKKGEEKNEEGRFVSRPHPLLVAWEGPTLWAERPQPPKKAHYTLMYGCQAASAGS